MTMSERILIMVKNKVVLKERDAWSDLVNFIGEMVAKYAGAMGLDKLPDPDLYLCRERIRQLYTELYKEKNITQFRNTKMSIERNIEMIMIPDLSFRTGCETEIQLSFWLFGKNFIIRILTVCNSRRLEVRQD